MDTFYLIYVFFHKKNMEKKEQNTPYCIIIMIITMMYPIIICEAIIKALFLKS